MAYIIDKWGCVIPNNICPYYAERDILDFDEVGYDNSLEEGIKETRILFNDFCEINHDKPFSIEMIRNFYKHITGTEPVSTDDNVKQHHKCCSKYRMLRSYEYNFYSLCVNLTFYPHDENCENFVKEEHDKEGSFADYITEQYVGEMIEIIDLDEPI